MKPELVEIELTQFPVTPREHATIQEPVAIDSIDNSSDDESVKSWHSCLDRPARPMLPQHLRIAVQDDDVEEGVLAPPDMPPVCVVRPFHAQEDLEAGIFRLNEHEVAQMLWPEWRVTLVWIYNYLWGGLTLRERVHLILIFIGVTLLVRWLQ